MKFRSLSILILIVLSSGCTYQKAMHDGQVYSESGMHQEALQAYRNAWSTKGRAEARVAMQRSAEAHLSDLISEAQQALFTGNLEKAWEISQDANRFVASMGPMDLLGEAQLARLEFDIKVSDEAQRFDRAEELIQDGRFEEAEDELLALLRKYPENEEAEFLLVMAQVYPAYNAGLLAMEKGLYRQAYQNFLEVTRKDAAFKDALELRDECLEKASFRLAYVPIHAAGIPTDVELKIAASVKKQLLAAEDPFLKLLDRENMDKLLDEQMQGMSGLFDEEKAAQAGKLEGAEYVLAVEVIRYENKMGRLQSAERKGYLGTSLRAASKVRYMEYYRKRSVEASVRYQVIHAETGQVFMSEMIPYNANDIVNYAVFDGPSEELHPGEWQYKIIGSRYDVVDVEGFDDLQKRLQSRRQLASRATMENDMLEFVAMDIAHAIGGFEPGR